VLDRSEKAADAEPAPTERTSCPTMDMGTLQSHDRQQSIAKAVTSTHYINWQPSSIHCQVSISRVLRANQVNQGNCPM
ncbi:MAG: hypothetical protein V2A34_14185, partial [Lentisphaerota bacterium]